MVIDGTGAPPYGPVDIVNMYAASKWCMERIAQVYQAFVEVSNFSRIATIPEIAAEAYSLSIPLYVKRAKGTDSLSGSLSLSQAWADWEAQSQVFWQEMDKLVALLNELTE